MIMEYVPSYLLGSGIMDHPARWYIVGMAYSSLTLICLMFWTLWVTLGTNMGIKNRNLKSILGVIGIILLYLLFDYCSCKYTEIMNNERMAQKVSGNWDFTFKEDSTGNICIYENIKIK